MYRQVARSERFSSARSERARSGEIDAQAEPDLAYAANKIIELVPGQKQYFHE